MRKLSGSGGRGSRIHGCSWTRPGRDRPTCPTFRVQTSDSGAPRCGGNTDSDDRGGGRGVSPAPPLSSGSSGHTITVTVTVTVTVTATIPRMIRARLVRVARGRSPGCGPGPHTRPNQAALHPGRPAGRRRPATRRLQRRQIGAQTRSKPSAARGPGQVSTPRGCPPAPHHAGPAAGVQRRRQATPAAPPAPPDPVPATPCVWRNRVKSALRGTPWGHVWLTRLHPRRPSPADSPPLGRRAPPSVPTVPFIRIPRSVYCSDASIAVYIARSRQSRRGLHGQQIGIVPYKGIIHYIPTTIFLLKEYNRNIILCSF